MVGLETHQTCNSIQILPRAKISNLPASANLKEFIATVYNMNTISRNRDFKSKHLWNNCNIVRKPSENQLPQHKFKVFYNSFHNRTQIFGEARKIQCLELTRLTNLDFPKSTYFVYQFLSLELGKIHCGMKAHIYDLILRNLKLWLIFRVQKTL